MSAAVSSSDERPLLSGVLTFLMTDVVGSTTLWESAPGLMDAALSRHDHLVEATVEQHGGILLKHRGEGDSTFCVFSSPSEAAAAAIEAQRRLMAETWDEATPIRVRMGLHTGDSILRGRDYYGQTINRTARVRAVAGAGQVVLSATTANLISSSLPRDTDLRFLRHEILRGIERTEAIHELVDLLRPVEPEQSSPPLELWALPPAVAGAARQGFAGRPQLLTHMHDAMAATAGGELQVVLLNGEPGSGKSTLSAAVALRAQQEGWVVLGGTCVPDATVPYEPFREALAPYVQHVPTELLQQHVTEHGGEVARLAPQLAARVGAVTPIETLDPETTRQLLAEAVVDLLARGARKRPVLMVLEDLQWADQNALLLLRRLTRTAPGVQLMIVCTVRSEDATESRLAETLNALRALPHCTELAVGELDEADILALLELRAGHGLASEGTALARYLRDQTGGNAYFATELLRHFVETGVIARDPLGRWTVKVDIAKVDVPNSIRSVLQQRISRIDRDSQRVLALASVAGREFDTGLLATVLGRSELDVLDAVEAAAASSLVRETGVGRFEFAHALVRLSIYDGLGATRRGLYHQQLAEALDTQLGSKAPAAVMVEHWASTGRDDRAKVALWAQRAGDAAMAALSPDEALNFFRRAIDSAGDDDHRRLGLLISLGDAQRWAGSQAFRRTLLDAASLAVRLGDHDALIRAALANNRGGTSASGTVDTERVSVLEQAITVVGPHDSAQRACLLATLSIELSQVHDVARRNALADEAVSCARRLDDELTLLRVLALTTEATRLPATLDRRLADTNELFDIAVRLGDPVLLGTAAVRDARVKFEAARFEEVDAAIAVLEEVAALNPYARWNLPILKGCMAQVRGDLQLALQLAGEARDIAVADGQPDANAVYVAQIADMYWDTGTLGRLLPVIEQTVEANPGITGFRAFLALACCDIDDFDRARQILRHEVDTRFAEHPDGPVWLITMSIFASVCIELDDRPAATLLYDILSPWRGRANASNVSTNGLVTESLAGLAVAARQLDVADQDCHDALEQARRTGSSVSELRTALTHARLLMHRDGAGELDAAVDELTQVQQRAALLGMATVERRATELLQMLEAVRTARA